MNVYLNGLIALSLLTASGANAALTQLQIGYYTDYTVQISYAGGQQNESVYATAFNARAVGGDPLPGGYGNPFTTFCIDIGSTLATPAYWQSGDFPSADNGNTLDWMPNGIDRAVNLYNRYASGVDFTTAGGKQNGAALQLAIWEVLYENSGTYNVRDGAGFRAVGSSGVLDSANAMLASQGNSASGSWTTTFWNAVNPEGTPIANQDLIGPPLPTGFAPEPGTGLAAGCAGIYMLATDIWRNVSGRRMK